MRKLIYSVVCLLICCSAYCASEVERYKIIYISTSEIKIGGVAHRVGDIFTSGMEIEWMNPNQVIKTINMTTKKQQIFKPEPIEVVTSHTTNDYMNLNYNLSTRDELTPAEYFFLEYDSPYEGKVTIPVVEGMSLPVLPDVKVSLMYCDAQSGEDKLIVDDFYGFLEEFRFADKIVSYVIDAEEYWDIYKWLVWALMPRPYCEVALSLEDIVLYRSFN